VTAAPTSPRSKAMLYPLIFQPILKERVWGGRNLERLYQKSLPAGVPIGESWEISDRPEGVSVIANGVLAGKDLRWLMEHHATDLLGPAKPCQGRFPLLVKVLDAQDRLSLQVHPPLGVASRLAGEPKTEMWYVTDAAPGAELYVGLNAGVTRESFAAKLKAGTVADCFHRLPVRKDDAMFLPSGRVHAIGAGNVIFEIQQNSDTTYRVFDWNRVGLDGRPRELHLDQALASINFDDFEPALIRSKFSRSPSIRTRYLVSDPLFTVDAFQVRRRERFHVRCPAPLVLGVVRGRLRLSHAETEVSLRDGQFCLVPACLERFGVCAETRTTFLQAQPG
jgi:mannose-6-phosphate isomerase